MKKFIKIYHAALKHFVVFQLMNIGVMLAFRLTTSIGIYTIWVGVMTSIILFILLAAYSINTLPFRFIDMFKAIIIGYFYFDLVYVIGYFSYGFNQIGIELFIFIAFELFTFYVYILWFSFFRESSSIGYNEEKAVIIKESATKDYLIGIVKLCLLIIVVALFKHSEISSHISMGNIGQLLSLLFLIVLILKGEFIVKPFKKTYDKVVDRS